MSDLPKLVHWRDFSGVQEGDVIEMDAFKPDSTSKADQIVGWFQCKHLYEVFEKLGLEAEPVVTKENGIWETMRVVKKNKAS